jgi:hypothetical protein
VPRKVVLTTESQRIAIAEFCGAVWKRQSFSPWYPDDESRNVYFRRLYFIEPGDIRGPATLQDAFGCEVVADDHSHLPSYLTDLNAMRCALDRLNRQQRVDFMNTLRKIEKGPTSDFDCIMSDRWPEALLRTIGKWVEE